jgi:hypothetical protein
MKNILLSLTIITLLTGFYPLSSAKAPVKQRTADAPVNFQQNVAIDVTLQDSCTGELVHITGQGHYETHGSINKNRILTQSHFNVQGLKGIGLSSGTKYIGTETSNLVQNNALLGGSGTFTEVHSFKMVSAGSKNNLFLKSIVHLTFLPNGTVSAFKGDFRSGCQ